MLFFLPLEIGLWIMIPWKHNYLNVCFVQFYDKNRKIHEVFSWADMCTWRVNDMTLKEVLTEYQNRVNDRLKQAIDNLPVVAPKLKEASVL